MPSTIPSPIAAGRAGQASPDAATPEAQLQEYAA